MDSRPTTPSTTASQRPRRPPVGPRQRNATSPTRSPPPLSDSRGSSRPSSRQQAASLHPPPEIKFESVPVQWKGLPLEAALWTYTTQDMQEIVSRAIRSSTQDSSIRLLPIETLDTAIPAEIDCLGTVKAATQSKYRFNVQRRTMILQALFLSCPTHEPIAQLAEIVAECDAVCEELVRVTDQLGQLGKLVEAHLGSGMAIALRKLNGSYGMKCRELGEAQERIGQLEAELEDAWKEAEGMARELDERDEEETAFPSDDDDESEREAEGDDTGPLSLGDVLPVRMSSPSASSTIMNIPPADSPLSPTLPAVPENFPLSPPTKEPNTDCTSLRSKRSTKTHQSRVSSARRRSLRASRSSLRFPRTHDIPPVPKNQSSSHPLPSRASFTSFLDFDSRDPSVTDLARTLGVGLMRSRKASVDDMDLGVVRRKEEGEQRRAPVDDILIMPTTTKEDDEEDDKGTVETSRPRPINRPSSTVFSQPPPPLNRTSTSDAISSMWLDVDSPTNPGASSSVSTSYRKLKSFTKRYATPLPNIMARPFLSLKSGRGK